MKKISILLLAISSLFVFSCDKDFEEVNTDPNSPQKVPAHLLLGSTIRNTQAATYNAFQGGDMGSVWAQHWSKVQYNDEERYFPRVASIANIWNVFYTTVIYDAKQMEKLAIEEGNSNLQGVSLVMQANAFQVLTDLYGAIPFSEAGIKGVLKPKYDSQEVVYAGIIDMLSRADALLATDSGVIPATSDLIYAGNASKWRKLANSLKLKALMRISKAPGVNNSAEIQALVAAGNLMSSNSDSAQIYNLSSTAEANPTSQTLVSRLEYKVSTVLVAKMNLYADARLPIFAKPVGTAYVGNVPGVLSVNYAGTSGVGAFYVSPTLPGVIMSYSQVQFLLAEAANENYITNNPAVTATESTSEIYFRNGVIANFEFNGLTVPQGLAYASQPSFDYATTISGREIIAEQVWLSLYGQGFEAWTEWRRTGFPALSPAVGANPQVVVIPRRLTYPEKEPSVNQANYSAAVATITGGDKLSSRLWWNN
jgi:hypothetical protein